VSDGRAQARYTVLPEELTRSGLSDRAVRLWALLDRYAGAGGVAFPLQSTLAADLGCSLSALKRALAELKEGAWLSVWRRYPGGPCNYITNSTPDVVTVELIGGKTAARTGGVSPAVDEGQASGELQKDASVRKEQPAPSEQRAQRGTDSARKHARGEAEADALDPALALGLWDEPCVTSADSGPSSPRRRTDPDSPMGLAFEFKRRISAERWGWGAPANLKALAAHFRTLRDDGFSAQQLREAIERFAVEDGLRNPRVAPWKDFLAKRHLVLSGIRSAAEAGQMTSEQYWQVGNDRNLSWEDIGWEAAA
jgi:hypothetical protein